MHIISIFTKFVLVATASTAAELLPSEMLTISNFVVSLTTRAFESCNIVFLYSQSRDFNLLFNLETTVKTFELSYVNLQVSDSLLKNTAFFPTLGFESHHRENCALIIFSIDNAQTDPKLLFQFLTPTYSSVVKKDEDYFIFITKQRASSLPFEEFKSKIKFKIGMHIDETSRLQLQQHIACFFCETSGKTREISLSKVTIQRAFDSNNVALLRQELFPDMVRDFNGFQMTVSYPITPTYMGELEQAANGEYQARRGVYPMSTAFILAPYFNLTVKFKPVTYSGVLLSNGTWDGVIGDVLGGRSHAGLATGATFQRNFYMGFTFPIAYDYLMFVYTKTHEKLTWTGLYKPFPHLLWLLLFFSIVLTALTLAVSYKYSGGNYQLGLMTAVVLRTLFDQNCRHLPTKKALLTWLIGTWFLFAMVMTTVYRTKLFGSLMVPSQVISPRDFTELAATDENSWGMYAFGPAYQLFKTSVDPTYMIIFEKMQSFNSPYDCYKRATKPKFACITWLSSRMYHTSKYFTDRLRRTPLVSSESSTYLFPCGLVVQKGAIFKAHFDRVLHMAHVTGIMKKLDLDDQDFVYEEGRFNRTFSFDSNASSVAVVLKGRHFVGPFGALFIGLTLKAL